MKPLKQLYGSVLEAVGTMPSFKRDLRWTIIYGVVIYAAVLALRLSFAGRWDHPELWVGGERILATHDAYYWLAKAKGVGQIAGYPLAQLSGWLHDWAGFGLGSIGFWMPPVVATLVGGVCYLWGESLAGKGAGIAAGLAGSLTPGFFYRSRLGYFDTDMFTLLVPILVTWMLAYWLSGYLRSGWFVDRSNDSEEPQAPASFWMILFFGLVTRVLSVFHYDIINFDVMLVFLAICLVLVNGRAGKRMQALYGMVIFILVTFPGSNQALLTLWPFSYLELALGIPLGVLSSKAGILCAATLAFFLGKHPGRLPEFMDKWWVCSITLLGVVILTKLAYIPMIDVWSKLTLYATPAGNGAVKEALGPVYPSVVQSIIEAKLVPLGEILERGAYFSWLGWFALLSGVFVVVLRPASVLLLPLVALHLASVKLGIRFSMFGGAPLMVFFGVGLYWLTRMLFNGFSRKMFLAVTVQFVLGVALLGHSFIAYGKLPLTPVIPRAHAEALIELGKISSTDAMIWTWWDWGYASQYYAGRKTVADGGKHAGRDVYPIGYVMATDSPEKANRMVAFSAQYPTPGLANIGLSPALVWDVIPRNELSDALEKELTRTDYPATPKQYLVVTWKDLNIIKWITYFGNWNLQTGTTRQAKSGSFNPGQLGINTQRGAVVNRQGGGGLVKDITVLDWDNSQSKSYFLNAMSPQLLPQRQHLIINKVTRQSVLVDRIGYRSLMRRLFTDDPKDQELAKHFKIVVDKLPFARIYEVIQ